MIQSDDRIGGYPRYIYTTETVNLMIIPDEIRKCVVFVGYETKTGHKKTAGTAFFLGRKIEGTDRYFIYAVTAKHVIDDIKKRSCYKVFLRLNIAGAGAKWVETDLLEWRSHPTDDLVDVAVFKFVLSEELDHKFYPLESMVDPKIIEEFAVGIGDEVFLVGLFSQHYGSQRNIPIARVGNIAAMPEEKIFTKDWGAIDAYLIEARSIGGISGSPVFAYIGSTRPMRGRLSYLEGSPAFYLLGLMHGHWDASASDLDVVVEDRIGHERVNMGIAIVVPAIKILEVISQPEIRKVESPQEDEIRWMNSPVMDAALCTFTTDTNDLTPGQTEEGAMEFLTSQHLWENESVSTIPPSSIDEDSRGEEERTGLPQDRRRCLGFSGTGRVV
jgi:hypothetical protein